MYASSSGSIAMSGGSITNNTISGASAYGGGVYMLGGTFTVSGHVTITGNTNSTDSTNSNVYLISNAVIKIAGTLASSSPIGVDMQKPGMFTSGWSENMGSAEPGSYFSSDDSSYRIAELNGELYLVSGSIVRFNLGGADGTAPEAQIVETGGKATQPGTDPTWTGHTFTGWYHDDTEWDFDTVVTGDMTLTAHWTLDEPGVTLTASTTDVTYNNGEVVITLTAAPSHSASDTVSYSYVWYKGTEVLEGETDSTLELTDVNDSGSYKVVVTASVGALTSQPVTSSAVTVAIGKADPVTTWPTASAITYGQSLSASNLTGGVATVDGAFTWEDGSVTPASGSQSYTVVFTPADRDNYAAVEQTVTVQVDKATLTPSVASVNGKTYDGNTSTTGTISLTGAVLDEQPTASGVFTFEDADAGTDKTVKVTVTLDDDWGDNYELSTDQLTTKADITPKTVGLTWSGYDNLVYDGESVSVTAQATGLVGQDVCTVTVEGGSQVNQGTHTAQVIGLSNDNYALPTTGTTQSYTIAPRPVELNWSASSFTYDGTEKTVTATVTNAAVESDSFTLTYTENTGTNASSYTATVTALGNDNYTLDGGTGLTHSWTIHKAVVSFTVTDNTHTYDNTAKTATVAQTEGELTEIGADQYSVTYGADKAENQTNAGTYDITVTILNPNFCFAGEQTSMVVGQLTIGQKVITGTWQGIRQVYGDNGSAKILLDGLADGDGNVEVTYHYTGTNGTVYDSNTPPTAAGTYTVTAVTDNYDLTNGTATLVIEKKPVTVTVTGNAATAGSVTPPTIQAEGLNQGDYTVTYRDSQGNAVSNPTQPGTYQVWVEFTNPNFRHPDGSTNKQVGTFTIAQQPPTLYTVSFDGNGAGGDDMASLELAGGSLLTLPVCSYTKSGSQFTGWLYNGKVYQPGDQVTTAYGDMTFTAQWQQTYGITITVRGPVEDEDEDEEMRTVSGAVVSLWLGANKLDEQTTGSDGTYTFADLLPGTYNLVVSKGDRTVTTMVELTTQNVAETADLPKGATNSIVEVAPGSPDIVVGYLDTVFDGVDGEVYTEDDQKTVTAGGKVEITFTAEEKNQEDEAVTSDVEKITQAAPSNVNLGLVMDYKLTKTVTTAAAETAPTVTTITQSSVLLEVLLPLPTQLQGKDSYAVYRVHGDEAQTLPQGADNANGNGEYFTVSNDKTSLTLYVKCFSTYAIGYTEYTGGVPSAPTYPPDIAQPEHGAVTVSPTAPKTGDEVTITPSPEEGYAVDEVAVTDAGGKPVEVTPNDDGTYTFTQPSGKVTITVTFVEEGKEPLPFTDVAETEWYYDEVYYVWENGLMNGVGGSRFAPEDDTSRAMFITTLWRMEGQPGSDYELNYNDVGENLWYTEAVRWATEHGIMEGYAGGFHPDDAMTREQLAAILYRYAQYKGYDVSDQGDLSRFTDQGAISGWARDYMVWAVGAGMLHGSANQITPQNSAIRAQTAAVLMRFAQDVAQSSF